MTAVSTAKNLLSALCIPAEVANEGLCLFPALQIDTAPHGNIG
jgi:hypothetical protein